MLAAAPLFTGAEAQENQAIKELAGCAIGGSG
jgi:hypothetical protein